VSFLLAALDEIPEPVARNDKLLERERDYDLNCRDGDQTKKRYYFGSDVFELAELGKLVLSRAGSPYLKAELLSWAIWAIWATAQLFRKSLPLSSAFSDELPTQLSKIYP
jgi:hypothetical protein